MWARPCATGGATGTWTARASTPARRSALALAGVTAVSQTAGPEAVLCGEAQLPYALLGYATATPVAELVRLIGASAEVFAQVLAAAASALPGRPLTPPGTVYRFER